MLRYVGDGTEVPGVPPRDLTAEEEDQFGAVIAEVDAARVAAGLGRLYEVVDGVDGVDGERDGHGRTRTGTGTDTDMATAGHGPGDGATDAEVAGGRRRGRRGDG